MPQPFSRLTSPAAPIDEDNIDTDAILPARYLLMLDRREAAEGLFRDRRGDGGFILDQAPFRTARILIGGANFGCGSSREQAPWALVDNGITCVIARSFGDIFHANCIRNGILPIALGAAEHHRIVEYCASGAPITVDLELCTIGAPGLADTAFRIDAGARAALLHGWDETDTILGLYAADIDAFERAQADRMPWLYDDAHLADALPREASSTL